MGVACSLCAAYEVMWVACSLCVACEVMCMWHVAYVAFIFCPQKLCRLMVRLLQVCGRKQLLSSESAAALLNEELNTTIS